MGDDLVFARHYVNDAKAHMTLLLSEDRLDIHKSLNRLIELETGAKRLRARGIYEKCSLIQNRIKAKDRQPRIDGHILTLNKMIRQYESGLDEITTADMSKSISPEIRSAGDMTAQKNINAPTQDKPVHIAPIAAQHKRARDILMPLLQNLENASLKDSLEILTQLPPSHLTKSSNINFESLMPRVSSEILRLARQSNQVVSISYRTTEQKLPHLFIDNLTALMIDIGGLIIQGAGRQQDDISHPSLDISFTLCKDKGVNALQVDVNHNLHEPHVENLASIKKILNQGGHLSVGNNHIIIGPIYPGDALQSVDMSTHKTGAYL